MRYRRPYIQLHRLGKRTDTGGAAEDIRAGGDTSFCCCRQCHIRLSGRGKAGYREPAPVPVRNTSLFTPGCREHWQHRGKSLQAGGDKAGARRQEGHPYLPAQPGVLHAGERRPTARHHADPGTYSPGFP